MAVCALNEFENVFDDIDRRCRTCLGICVEFSALSRYIQVGESRLSLTELILKCASVQIVEEDGLPQRICESCKETAIKSHLFKIQCETSNQYLQSLFHPTKPKQETVDENKTPAYDTSQHDESEETDSADNAEPCSNPGETPASNLKRRTCGFCDKTFQYRTSMLKHQKKHTAPPRTCPHCPYKPPTPNSLSKHMEQSHAHLKTFTCSLCNKAFFKKANLCLHVQVHTGVKKHTCEICGMSFVLRGNLSVHRRLHTGEKPYTCSECGRGFTQQSALRSHEAGHSDRRDHVCSECGAAFSRVGALRNHQKRHSEVRNFECSVCGKRFTFSSDRKRHMLIHTGDKNFECEVCGRRFTRATNLKVHKRIHTGETPHMCAVCGKGFIQAHCLRTHMNTHA